MRIGFVGLGTQGKPLARNILAGGFDTTVFDIRAEAVDELVALGAKTATTLEELGRASDLVIVCVVDDAQVEEVLAGAGGVLGALAPGAIVLIHSTIYPSTVKALHELGKQRDVEVVDAPVSGGERGAIARTMSYMLGCDADVFARIKPVLQASGENIARIGPVGSAATAKLVHQVVLCGNMMAIAEGIRLGEAAGLERATIRRVVREGWAQSKIAEIWGDPVTAVTEAIFFKDLRLALALARDHDAKLPATALCQQILNDVLPS